MLGAIKPHNAKHETKGAKANALAPLNVFLHSVKVALVKRLIEFLARCTPRFSRSTACFCYVIISHRHINNLREEVKKVKQPQKTKEPAH